MNDNQDKHDKQSVGVGHGMAGRYGGLPEEFSGSDARIVILPVPFDKTTTYQKGSDKGPEALIEASRNMELYDIETGSQPYLLGIYTDKAIVSSSSEAMLSTVYETTKKFLQQDKFVITLGGEHAISPAPIKAYAERYPGLSVLQLDAHADLQPAYEGNPHSHASAMARVKEIDGVSGLVAVGIRSMSEEEVEHMDKERTYWAHDIWNDDAWMEKAVDQLSEQVYLTFDLDVFDPSIMASTGTPEPGGLGWYQTLKFLKLVASRKQIVGFDIVELCPKDTDKSCDFLAAKLVYKLLSYIFCSTLSKTGEK